VPLSTRTGSASENGMGMHLLKADPFHGHLRERTVPSYIPFGVHRRSDSVRS
jgi:hypothetical protein